MIEGLHTLLGPVGLGALAGLWALKLAVGYGAVRLWRARRVRVRAGGRR